VKNEVLQKVKEEMDTLHIAKRSQANRIGHNLRRNCPLQHVAEGYIEERIPVTEDGEED
jgi:hypothetical protein